MSQILQWHPAFQAAMQIELSEEMDKLEFLKEYNLTSGPLRIDTLIIKKEKDAEIQKQIGRIFKRYNILEYKSPEKSHTVNSFFKVVSYAGLLQSNTQREQEIPPEEITITLIGDRYPRRLLAYLKRRHRVGIEQAYPGIYYVEGLLFPMQVIVQRELDKGENVWLSRLRQNLQMQEDVEALARAYKGKDGNPLYSAVMDLIVRANWKIYEEGETVCDALNELFADKLEAFGWNVIEIDGHDVEEIYEAVCSAKTMDRPTAIIANTIKGKGVSYMENNAGWHGKAPNDAEYETAMKELSR